MAEILSFLREQDCLPNVGTPWEYTLDTLFSGVHLENITIFHIMLSGKLLKENQFQKMKININIHYRCGNCNPYSFSKHVVGLENAFLCVLQLDKHVSSCSECSLLFEDKENRNICKDCSFFKFHRSFHTDQETICSICQEPVYRFRLDCGHFFHMGCLSKLDQDHLRCPNCRQPISQSFLSKYFMFPKTTSQVCFYPTSDGFSENEETFV